MAKTTIKRKISIIKKLRFILQGSLLVSWILKNKVLILIEEKVGNRFEILDRGVSEQDRGSTGIKFNKLNSFCMSKDTIRAYRVAKRSLHLTKGQYLQYVNS